MKRILVKLAVLTAVGACVASPEGTQVLTQDALAAELSGQRLALPPPPDSGFVDGVLFLAELRQNGSARLTSTLDGEPVDGFDETERWQVRGQELCIFDTPQPESSDCARIEWIGNGQFRFNNADTGENGVGTYAPI